MRKSGVMATPTEKPVSVEIEVEDEIGKKGKAVLTVHQWGVSIKGKGKGCELKAKWVDVVRGIPYVTLGHMPAKYVCNKIGWILEGAKDGQCDGESEGSAE